MASNHDLNTVVLKLCGSWRNDCSIAAENEADTLDQQMRKTYVEFKRARENATAAANLEQRAKAGLKHVAEILGIKQVSDLHIALCCSSD